MSDYEKDKEFSFNKLDPKNWNINKTKEKVFQCPECNELFNTKKEHKKHQQEVHGAMCFYCKSYILRTKWENHITKYHLPIVCPICNQICNGKKELSKHTRKKHGFECAICKGKFLSEKALSDHVTKKHHPLKEKQNHASKKTRSSKKEKKVKKIYRCPHCKLEFSRKAYFEHDRKKCLQKSIDAFLYSKNREKLIDEDPIRIIKNGNEKIVSCDLHELFLDEAKAIVMETITMCVQNKIEQLEIIHGHRHGQVLQSYFRSEDFLNEISTSRFKVEIINIFNPGSTIIKLNAH